MGKTLEKTLNTKPKLAGASALSLILSYTFASLALGSASYLQYILSIFFFVYAIKFLAKFVRKQLMHS